MRMILLVGQAGDLLPEVEGLVVVDIDGDHQPVARQAEFLGDQVPGELDGALLEIVAEREIAEHLEEGVVARGVADIVEVVVLAAGAHAFLRGGGARIGALLEAGEDVLELHHAGIGEHQRRVVARHQRRRRHDRVAVPARNNRGNVDRISLTPLMLLALAVHALRGRSGRQIGRLAVSQTARFSGEVAGVSTKARHGPNRGDARPDGQRGACIATRR